MAYRSGPKRVTDVRELTMAAMGSFGTILWCGLVVVMGATLAAALHFGAPGGLTAGAAKTLAGATAGGVALVAAWIALFDHRVRLVARIDDGVLEVHDRARAGREPPLAIAFGEIAGVSVEEHGEDHVATVLHVGDKQVPVFVTRIGDDARHVEAFVAAALAAWQRFAEDGPTFASAAATSR